MSLKEYRQKRNFDNSPEPKAAKSKGSRHRFVVQRHDARKLHYDLRLEAGGVLKSWAVPKGPSMNPADKRLAIMTEDHPVKYLTFEGVIPEGNYGAGKMDIWDTGTYQPEKDQPLEKQLEEGSVKFVFQGNRLKGKFSLAKMKGSEKPQWLLIKQPDEYAVSIPYNSNEIPPLHDEKSTTAPEAPFPGQIRPMLARLADQPFDHPQWVFEPKLDGYRAIAAVENGKVSLYSRKGNSFNEDYPEIVETLQNLEFNAVLDGEVVVLNKENISHFNALQRFKKSRKGNLAFLVFDLLYLDGRNLMPLPLRQRKAELQRILLNLPGIVYCPHIEEYGLGYFHEAVEKGQEGIIAKKADSNYTPGARSSHWLKFKAKKGQEVVIGGFTEAKDNRPFGALLLGVYEGKKLRFVGHCGTGWSRRDQDELYEQFKPLVRKTSPFSRKVKANAPPTWMSPRLVCEVEFQNWTPDGIMRHPSFKGLRSDKNPKEITRERPIDSDRQVESTATAPKAKKPEVVASGNTLIINDTEVEVSNLEKVFWPDAGWTKFHLLNYYIKVSDIMLPYLLDRPQSLHRHPDGITGEGFFQKNVAGMVPDWIETVTISSKSKGKDIEYLVCQNLATLLYIVNLGCIEINPWNSRRQKIEYPDYAILDLDPGEQTDFQDVVKTALAAKEILDEAGIKCYCKTSGSKGMHLLIPTGARYEYKQVRDFIKAIGLLVNKRLPDLTSLKRSPKERRDKIYLDYLQNKRGATLAAPYSARPRPGATVSAPLEWEEVTMDLHPSQFTIQNMPERLDEKGDLLLGLLGEGIDMLAALERLMGK